MSDCSDLIYSLVINFNDNIKLISSLLYMYSYEELKAILGHDKYYTEEQIKYIALKLVDKNHNSFYLQSVMAGDLKKLKGSIKDK